MTHYLLLKDKKNTVSAKALPVFAGNQEICEILFTEPDLFPVQAMISVENSKLTWTNCLGEKTIDETSLKEKGLSIIGFSSKNSIDPLNQLWAREQHFTSQKGSGFQSLAMFHKPAKVRIASFAILFCALLVGLFTVISMTGNEAKPDLSGETVNLALGINKKKMYGNVGQLSSIHNQITYEVSLTESPSTSGVFSMRLWGLSYQDRITVEVNGKKAWGNRRQEACILSGCDQEVLVTNSLLQKGKNTFTITNHDPKQFWAIMNTSFFLRQPASEAEQIRIKKLLDQAELLFSRKHISTANMFSARANLDRITKILGASIVSESMQSTIDALNTEVDIAIKRYVDDSLFEIDRSIRSGDMIKAKNVAQEMERFFPDPATTVGLKVHKIMERLENLK
ncbi:MAG: hypothetical protein HRU19_08740 [Pseudobacteriovorax sp.]|nr:hypothetical protein [Pseudobacteriovorax sp.]